jgi:hypothetical protein
MKKEKEEFFRECPICKEVFITTCRTKIICSLSCRKKSLRQVKFMRETLPNIKCEICGFPLTVDAHHEEGIVRWLCPNHHALITRGICTFEELPLFNLDDKVLKMGMKK